MANPLNILIQASLDKTSKDRIEKQLQQLRLQPIEIKISSKELDVLTKFTNEMKNIASAVGVVNDKLLKTSQIMKNPQTGEFMRRTQTYTDSGILETWSKISQKQKEAYENDLKINQQLKNQDVTLNNIDKNADKSLQKEKAKTKELKEQSQLYKIVQTRNQDGDVSLTKQYKETKSGNKIVSYLDADNQLFKSNLTKELDLSPSGKQKQNYSDYLYNLNKSFEIKKQIAKLDDNSSKQVRDSLEKELVLYENRTKSIKQRKVKVDGEDIGYINSQQQEKIRRKTDELERSLQTAKTRTEEAITNKLAQEEAKRVKLVENYKNQSIKNIDAVADKYKHLIPQDKHNELMQQRNIIANINTADVNNNIDTLKQYDQQLEKVIADTRRLGEEQYRLNKLGANEDVLKSQTLQSANVDRLFKPENKRELQAYLEQLYGVKTKILDLQHTVDSAGNGIVRFTKEVKNNNGTFEQTRTVIDKTTKTIRDNGAVTRNELNRNLDAAQRLRTAIRSIPVWFGVMTAYMQAVRFIRGGIQYVVDMDNAMNQLRIVSGLTEQQAVQLGKTYNQMAREMSVSATEIAEASVEFARQGLSQEQVNQRLQETIKYAKISGLEFTEASEIMTATVNSMEIDIERAADVFSYLGDATATGIICAPYRGNMVA